MDRVNLLILTFVVVFVFGFHVFFWIVVDAYVGFVDSDVDLPCLWCDF